jgi:hypothetical protein
MDEHADMAEDSAWNRRPERTQPMSNDQLLKLRDEVLGFQKATFELQKMEANRHRCSTNGRAGICKGLRKELPCHSRVSRGPFGGDVLRPCRARLCLANRPSLAVP